jgi:hypothetical protein
VDMVSNLKRTYRSGSFGWCGNCADQTSRFLFPYFLASTFVISSIFPFFPTLKLKTSRNSACISCSFGGCGVGSGQRLFAPSTRTDNPDKGRNHHEWQFPLRRCAFGNSPGRLDRFRTNVLLTSFSCSPSPCSRRLWTWVLRRQRPRDGVRTQLLGSASVGTLQWTHVQRRPKPRQYQPYLPKPSLCAKPKGFLYVAR